jgi:tetratricopeptide (TPR) repeat protein
MPTVTTNLATLGKDQLDAIAVIGYQLYEQGKTDDAISMFDGLITLDNTNYLGFAGRGAIALYQEKLEDALVYLSKAAELNPTDAAVHANLGEAYLRLAKFEQATGEFSKALDLDPDEVDPGANRARAILDGMEIVINELERMKASHN